MKFDQLRYFLETARQGHIGKASSTLAISPSAISHSISELERELGRELFAKNGKNIVLTGHGKLLMERARTLLADVEAARDEIASDALELRGHYRLVATHLLCSRFLTPAWSRIQNTNPRLTAEIYSLRSAHVVSGLAAGDYDFGLCLNPQPQPSLDTRVLYEGELVLTVRKGHPLLKNGAGEIVKRISRYPACLPKAFQGVDNCESHPVFEKFGLKPESRLVFDSYEVAVEHIGASDAWALMPCWIARSHKDRLVSILPKGWRAPVFAAAVWPKNRPPTKALKRLMRGIEEGFGALPKFTNLRK